jgi:hypothetical protein
MTTSNSATATIYTFPPRGRFAEVGQQQNSTAANAALPRTLIAASGSGWYHDEAIRADSQAPRGRTN